MKNGFEKFGAWQQIVVGMLGMVFCGVQAVRCIIGGADVAVTLCLGATAALMGAMVKVSVAELRELRNRDK